MPHGNTIRVFVYLIVTALCLTPFAESQEHEFENELKHARTFLNFGLADKGNMADFKRAGEHLDQARSMLAELELSSAEKAHFEHIIEALGSDIEEQADIAHDTLFGVFPLLRFFGKTLFTDAHAAGIYELVDDPDIIAVTDAAESLVTEVISKVGPRRQLHVIITSIPHNPALENEVAVVFRGSKSFKVNLANDLAKVISKKQHQVFQEGRIEPALVEDMLRASSNAGLLILTVVEKDIIDGHFYYSVEGLLHIKALSAQPYGITRSGFCRDRRDLALPAISLQVVFFLLAYATYFLFWRTNREEKSVVALVMAPGIAFAFGRIMPWVLLPIARGFMPGPDTLVKLSFWYPPAVLTFMLLGMLLVCRLGFFRIAARLNPDIVTRVHMPATLVAVTLGTSAYLTIPLLLLREETGFRLLLPATIGLGLVALLICLALDQEAKTKPIVGITVAVLTLGLSTALCLAAEGWVWGATLSIAMTALFSAWKEIDRNRGPARPPITMYATGKIPQSVEELEKLALQPPFFSTGSFLEAQKDIAPFFQNKTAWLALTGPPGIGKTATAAAIIEYIIEKRRKIKDDSEPAYLWGACPDVPGKAQQAYAPFQQALAQHFQINLLADREGHVHRIEDAMEDLFTSFVPFSDLLFPPESSEVAIASSKEQIFLSIEKTIRRVANHNGAILFIDDIHWIDDSSLELLTFLLAQFPPNGNLPLTIIVSYRNKEDQEMFTGLGLGKFTVAVKRLSENERVELLVKNLGFTNTTARILIRELGTTGPEFGELFWLFSVIRHLAQAGVLVRTDDGFGFTESTDTKKLPIPGEFKEAITQVFNTYPEYRTVLECAACLGLSFSVNVLARSLDLSRLTTLEILEKIEHDTGLLRDDKAKDDVYEFHSSFVLNVIRNTRILNQGPNSDEVPQIIREFHARIASSLEQTLEVSNNKLDEVANHYYSAGSAHLKKAVEFCTLAATTANTTFNPSSARTYLEMARECTQTSGMTDTMEETFLLVECDATHVERQNQKETAGKACTFVENHPDVTVETLIAVTRACYDAGGVAGEQQYFRQAVELAHRIVKLSDENAVNKAEGYHFIGISLPLNNREERTKYLNLAINEVEKRHEDLQARALLGRALNSLGEQLSGGNEDDKANAQKCFERSISIKDKAGGRDLPGLALSYGGLGRLAYYEGDIEKAQPLFEKDLELSIEVGDIAGQCKMHSFLGGCSLKKGEYEEAAGSYLKSYDLALGEIDQHFAAAGRIEALAHLKRIEEVNTFGTSFVTTLKNQTMRDFCARALESALKECSDLELQEWTTELQRVIDLALEKNPAS